MVPSDLNINTNHDAQQAEVRIYQMSIWEAISQSQDDLGKLEKLIIENHITDFDKPRDKYSDTPLVSAAKTGNVDMLRFLIGKGANINKWSGVYGYTALMEAVCYDQPDIIELLIEYGADLNIKNGFFETAFVLAMKEEDWETAEFLVLHGADIEQRYLELYNKHIVGDDSQDKEVDD